MLEALVSHLTSDMPGQSHDGRGDFPSGKSFFYHKHSQTQDYRRDDDSIPVTWSVSERMLFFFGPLVNPGVNLIEPVSQGLGSSEALGHNLEELLISGL